MTLPPGTHLGPYRVTALLGVGGMGEVYRAFDPSLNRDVAIKVLPESFAEDPHALPRFEREARAVAALSHPNIRGIHELGHQADRVYAVMELLEGESLYARLRDGALPRSVALDYALQVARGLAAAQQKGIVHRDLKPDNLFVTGDGFVKILDFGLAKQRVTRSAASSAGTASALLGAGTVTEPGTVLGTLDYMSPEQLRGMEADRRSDIFSFGVVLHEMLTGRNPFRGENTAETMSAIAGGHPLDAALPPDLAPIVRRCLEQRPEDRYQSAAELVAELTALVSGARSGAAPMLASRRAPPLKGWWPLAAGALLLAGLAGAVLLLRRQAPPAAAGPKRIAVLPFENLGTADQEYFADGVADEVRGKLTSLPSLDVIARASSTPYKKTNKTPQQIAQELDVGYLLTGTIRWEKGAGGGRVQVTPELVEVHAKRAPSSRWQKRFAAELTDVFQVQSDIAASVAGELGVALGVAEERRLAQRPTTNLEAYDALLKGDEVSTGLATVDIAALRKAIGHYERAVALDPSFVQAWANLGIARSVLYYNSPSPDLIASARQASEKALELGPHQAAGHIAVEEYARWVSHEPQQALEASERARKLEPSNPQALAGSAVANMSLGRWDVAVELLRQALRADPRSVLSYRRLGAALRMLRRIPEAREVLARGLAVEPGDISIIENQALLSLAEGDLAAAREVARRASKTVDPRALTAFFATFYEVSFALPEELQDLLLTLTPADFGGDGGEWATKLSLAYAWKGDAKRSRGLAERALTELGKQLAANPQDGPLNSTYGLALALAGKGEEAVRAGQRAVATQQIARDEYLGPYYLGCLARIYILAGQPEKALDLLEPMLKKPANFTPGWLKVDPTFDPLRGNPRFARLVSA